MPFFMTPDEGAHFYRAYQISNGGIVSENIKSTTGGMIPKELKSYIENDFYTNVLDNHQSPPLSYNKYFTNRVNLKNQTFVDFRSSAIYSPMAYIPQAIGLKAAQVIYPSLGVMMVLARFVNLAVYILLISIAIRIAKKGKWVYVVLGLFPVAIQQAASLSSDVMTIGISFVWIAFIINMYLQREKISRKQWIIALILAIGLALTKQTNIILLLPVLFVPSGIFRDIWHKFRFIISVLGVGILAIVLWLLVMKLNNYNLQISKEALVDQTGQINFLLQHPLSVISILWRTYILGPWTDFYIRTMHGVFSWLTYSLPLSFTVFGYAGLLMTFMYDDTNISKLQRQDKSVKRLAIIYTLVFIISLIALAGTLYIAWTPVSQGWVNGIQGRYFLPIIPLLIPMFMVIREKLRITTSKPYAMGILVCIISGINLAMMLAVTYKWFY